MVIGLALWAIAAYLLGSYHSTSPAYTVHVHCVALTLISVQARVPAEFKHIIKPRKRN